MFKCHTETTDSTESYASLAMKKTERFKKMIRFYCWKSVKS